MRTRDEFEKYVREGGIKKRRAARAKTIRLASGGAALCVCVCVGAVLWLSPMQEQDANTITTVGTGVTATVSEKGAVTEIALEKTDSIIPTNGASDEGEVDIYNQEYAVTEPYMIPDSEIEDANFSSDDKKLVSSFDIYTLPSDENSMVTHIMDVEVVDRVYAALKSAWDGGTSCYYDGNNNGMSYNVKLYCGSTTVTYTLFGNYITRDDEAVWHRLTDAEAAELRALLDDIM